MNIKPIIILVASAFIVGGCGKSPTANNSGNQPPVQAEPFHGQVYKSLDGSTVLTLTSIEDCELMQNGTTFPCKYTKQTDALRIVATVMGTPQVIYYRFTDQGIQDNNGNVLLSPEGYAATTARLEQQREEEERKQEAEQLEKQRVAQEIVNSKIETQAISTFSLTSLPWAGLGRCDNCGTERTLTITDVSLKSHYVYYYNGNPNGTNDVEIYFSDIRKIFDIGAKDYWDPAQSRTATWDTSTGKSVFVPDNGFLVYSGEDPMISLDHKIIVGKITSETQSIHDAIVNAYNAWKTKFPDAVLK